MHNLPCDRQEQAVDAGYYEKSRFLISPDRNGKRYRRRREPCSAEQESRRINAGRSAPQHFIH